MHIDLTIVWAGIIAFAVFAYVVMDGFDLGIGILFPLLEKGEPRSAAINSVAPVWDGNETWLVLGGGGLLHARKARTLVGILDVDRPVGTALLRKPF